MSSSPSSPSSPSALCAVLGVDRPVLLAPMAKIAGGVLAAAVSEAGGMGFIGGGYGDLGWLAEQVELAGEARVGIGMVVWTLTPGALDAVLGHEPAAVWLAFGDPTPHVPAVHEAGALAVCLAATVGEAHEAAAAGADVIVVQGAEHGGHGRHGRSLFGLLPAIADVLPTMPLVAAGGITDRRGYDAAVALGAAGVALGTAFYATHEAIDVPAAKQRLVDAGGDDTVRNVVYDIVRGPEWPAGYDGRSLRSELTDRWVGHEDDLRSVAAEMADRHAEATRTGDVDFRVVWAGEGVDMIERVVPAADVVTRFPRP